MAPVNTPTVSGVPSKEAQYWLPPKNALGLGKSPLLLGYMLKPMSVVSRASPMEPMSKMLSSTTESNGNSIGASGIPAVEAGMITWITSA